MGTNNDIVRQLRGLGGCLEPAAVQKVTVAGSSGAVSAALAVHTPYLIVATAAMNFRLGVFGSTTAVVTDMYLPANTYLTVYTGPYTSIAFIGTGAAYVSPVTHDPEPTSTGIAGQYGS